MGCVRKLGAREVGVKALERVCVCVRVREERDRETETEQRIELDRAWGQSETDVDVSYIPHTCVQWGSNYVYSNRLSCIPLPRLAGMS